MYSVSAVPMIATIAFLKSKLIKRIYFVNLIGIILNFIGEFLTLIFLTQQEVDSYFIYCVYTGILFGFYGVSAYSLLLINLKNNFYIVTWCMFA